MIWWVVGGVAVVVTASIMAAFLHERRCPVCGRKFDTSDEMYDHLDTVHLR